VFRWIAAFVLLKVSTWDFQQLNAGSILSSLSGWHIHFYKWLRFL
jgi:hypothetical protein